MQTACKCATGDTWYAADIKTRFRWVQCQLDEIAKAKSPKDIEASLATVPRTLEELYNERLPRDPEDRYRFLWALKFLLAAPSPLQLTELAETTIIQCNAADGVHDSTLLTARPDSASRLFENTDILEILGPFARFEDQTGVVSIAHSSVRTFFLESKVVDSWFRLSPEMLHADVAFACLIYLTNVLRTSEAHGCTTTNFAQDYHVLVEEHPLLTYCAQYWPLHVVQSKDERSMLPLIRLYFTPEPTLLFSQWLRLLRQTSSTSYYVPGRWASHDNVTYHAISHGLVHTTETLLDAGVEINSVGGSWGGTLLHAACWTERPEILRCLLSRGVDYATEDQNEDTAYDLLLWLDQSEMQDAFFEHCRDLRPEDLGKSRHWVRIAELVLEKAIAFVSHIRCCTCGLTARSRLDHCQVCRRKWCFECRGFVSIVPGFPDSVAELRGIAKMDSITRNDTLEMRLRPNEEIFVSQPIMQDDPLASMHQVQDENRILFARSNPRSGDGTANRWEKILTFRQEDEQHDYEMLQCLYCAKAFRQSDNIRMHCEEEHQVRVRRRNGGYEIESKPEAPGYHKRTSGELDRRREYE